MDNFDESPNTTNTLTSDESNTCLTSNSIESSSDQETLWVGDLPLSATSSDVKKCFEQVASVSVVDVQIKKTSDSEKYPLNYAFVRMCSRTAAQDVYRALTSNDSLAVVVVNDESHKIRLGWARTNTTLHISHLDSSITEDTLYGLFSQYGELIAAPIGDKTHSNGAVIIHNAKNDSEAADKISPCTYATITFMLRENAEEARIALNGTLLGTKTIRVEWNRKKQSMKTQQQTVNSDLNNNMMVSSGNVISIYVQFESNDATVMRVNESFLMQVFEPFGSVTDCYIKSSNYSECGRRQHGYGFIHFENTYFGQQCARTAAQVVGTSGRFVYNGVILRSEVSRNFIKTTTAGEICDQAENKEMVLIESNIDRNSYVDHDVYDHHHHKKTNGYEPYLMMNNNMMFCGDGLSNSPCFYGTVMDMNGNQYLVPIQTPRMGAPLMMHSPQPWQTPSLDMNASPFLTYQTPQLMQMSAPMPSQIDYKSITSINPTMMFSEGFDQTA